MSDQNPQKRSLSEISHLFLSSVRDRQTDGAARPKRTPPPSSSTPSSETNAEAGAAREVARELARDLSIDLTPEEYAEVFGEPEVVGTRKSVPVTAVLGAHLNGKQFDRVKEYARHLAASASARIGLIELDACEFRLMCFEPATAGSAAHDAPATNPDTISAECYDPRRMAEALEEMNWDVDRWLLLVPSPRVPEARELFRLANHWVLLSTCDHDGVVAGYRTLKGLAESHRGDGAAAPRLSLALLDPATERDSQRVIGKLTSVCQQFLDWRLDAETPVAKAHRVAEHLVMFCRPTRDKAQVAAAPQWSIVADFLARAKSDSVEAATKATEANVTEREEIVMAAVAPEARKLVGDVVVPVAAPTAVAVATAGPSTASSRRVPVAEWRIDEPVGSAASVAAETAVATASAPRIDPAPTSVAGSIVPPVTAPTAAKTTDDVLDLPDAAASAGTILSALLQQAANGFVECPVRAPMCDGARLAVGRDRGVTLFAVAEQGLGGLRAIAQAYRWLIENRTLVGMAVPQFAIDPNQQPRLRLLVDESDVRADALQPMLQSGHVTVQGYRKLRWGNKTGLLLAAA